MTSPDEHMRAPAEPASPRARRSRTKLLRAATELLADAGPRAVTVDAVAELSGVAKSTLYRHWASRDELLVDVVRSNVPELSIPDLADGFEVALRRLIGDTAATLADAEWSRIVPAMMSLRTSMPELAEFVEADRLSKEEVLEAVLAHGIAEGALPADIDVLDSSTLLFGPLVFTAIMGDHDRLEHLADVIVDRFLASYRA